MFRVLAASHCPNTDLGPLYRWAAEFIEGKPASRSGLDPDEAQEKPTAYAGSLPGSVTVAPNNTGEVQQDEQGDDHTDYGKADPGS